MMCCVATEVTVIDQVVYFALSIVTLVILGPLVFWLIPKFAVFVIREIRLHRATQNALERVGDKGLLELLDTISALGNKEPLGCMLHEVTRSAGNGVYAVRLPDGIPDYPWSGQVITAERVKVDGEALEDTPVKFSLLQDATVEDLMAPRVYWPPCVGKRGKKSTHIYSPARLLKLSPEVTRIANDAMPGEPERFLEGVFRKFGLLEYSVRIGLTPEWVQQWRPQTCPKCSKPMRLIIQIPGYEVHKDLGEFVFYHFGCPRHADVTQSAWDVF